MSGLQIGLIWAQSSNGVIGAGGVMPWHVPEDLAHFKNVTAGRPVIMGRRTWDSLPERFRPLAGRRNIVVTRQQQWSAEGVEAVHSVADALTLAADGQGIVWVIGGAEIFASVIDDAVRLEVTEIREAFEGDTIAPAVGPRWSVADADPAEGWHRSRGGLEYRFLRYEPADRSASHRGHDEPVSAPVVAEGGS